MSAHDAFPQSFFESVAGLLAGAISTLVAHPLDVIKTRLQVDRVPSSHLGKSLRIAQSIARNEGSLTAFYRGLTPNIVGNSVSWSLYFVWYDRLKSGLHVYHGTKVGLSYYDFFIASGVAGALTAICTNPIWVIKTRMLSTPSSHPGAYTSILDGMQQIFSSEGIHGFYRGLMPSLFGVSHGALQFMAYEQLKIYRKSSLGRGQLNPSSSDIVFISGAAKVFAGGATYPYQVVRARLQTYDADKTYKNARDVVGRIWRQEGVSGFYKGMGPYLLRALPSTWVTFLVYENAMSFLPKALENNN